MSTQDNSTARQPLAPRRPRGPRPGPGRPSRAQTEARNRQLLDKALDLFLERGFDGTTIDAIIEAVGMSRRTVYARYKDKLALFKAALERAVDDWVVPESKLREAECDDLEQTLLAVARLMVANVRSPSGVRLARIANAEVFRMPDIGAYLWERTARVALAYLTDLFRRRLWPEPPGQQVIDDAAMAFLILIVEGSFQMTNWENRDDSEFDRQVEYRVRLFLHGARVTNENAA
ncbi:MAG: TetR/AcrR family transcriptional regulator [Novosphingobium sp.]|nr:TetR/AcrR family transcriptional regulator [Novosphingobium sp.]